MAALLLCNSAGPGGGRYEVGLEFLSHSRSPLFFLIIFFLGPLMKRSRLPAARSAFHREVAVFFLFRLTFFFFLQF